MNEQRTYYDILGVEQDSSYENIEKARNRMKYGSSDDRVPFWMWKEIDEAYDILSNPATRNDYDISLKKQNNELMSESPLKTTLEQVQEPIPKQEQEPIPKQEQEPTPKQEQEPTPKQEQEPTPEQEQEPIPKQEQEPTPEQEQEPTPKQAQEPTPEQASRLYTKFKEQQLNPSKIDTFFNKKVKPKAIKTGEYLAGLAGLGVMGIFVQKYFYKKYGKGAITLIHDNHVKTIKDLKIKTGVINYQEEYEKKLSTEIDNLLSKSHNNYTLQVKKLRYQNHLELWKKMFEVKLNEIQKNNSNLKARLELISIKNNILKSEAKLKNMEYAINKYDELVKTDKLESKLSKLNKKISVQMQAVDSSKSDSNFIKQEKEQKKLNKLIVSRNLKGSKFKLKHGGIGKVAKLSKPNLKIVYDVKKMNDNEFLNYINDFSEKSTDKIK